MRRRAKWRPVAAHLRVACAVAGFGTGGCATVLGIGDWTNLTDAGENDSTTGALDADATKGGPDATAARDDAGRDAPNDSLPSVDVVGEADAREDVADDAAIDGEGDVVADAETGPTSGTPSWAKNFGTAGDTVAMAVAMAPSNGDVLVVGNFAGSLNLGGGVVASQADAASGEDTFVARFDSSGAYEWSKTFGSGLITTATGVAVDAHGNVIVGGLFQGTMSFGGDPVSAVGVDDLFLVEFDSMGNYQWQRTFGTAGQAQVLNSVAVDSQGNVVIAGQGASLGLGGQPLTGYYLAKFGASGASDWSSAFSATTNQGGPWLTVDSEDNCILAGSFSSTLDFGANTLTSAGSLDAFVAKFNSSGAYQWAHQYGDASAQWITSVATDANTNIVVTGSFGGAIDFGGVALDAEAGVNAFLAKLDPMTGNGVWADQFVVPPQPQDARIELGALTVAVDGEGSPTIGCNLIGSIDFGGGALSSEGDHSAAVAHFDPTGKYRWAYSGGSPSTAEQSSAANNMSVAASDDAVVFAGGFGTCPTTCANSPLGTTLILGDETLRAISAEDLFLVSFAP
jgi:hypothetical protein